jgi:transposase, IS5 family
MQYFPGTSTFTPEALFDASLFVEFRKRLGMDCLNEINEQIVALKTKLELAKSGSATGKGEGPDENGIGHTDDSETAYKGRVIFDATACPQDIAYPTDLDLLSSAREKSEQLIDILYNLSFLSGTKTDVRHKVAFG